MDFAEVKYYGDVGLLYPFDVRYDAGDRAFCSPLPDGRIQFRVQTEPALVEAVLVYNDGRAQGAPLAAIGQERRYRTWEVTIQPRRRQITYSFAFKSAAGDIVYYCRHGIDHAVEPLDRWTLDLDDPALAPFAPPDWMRGAVVYQIFPDRFANGDRSNDPAGTVPWGTPPAWMAFQGGDLDGVIERLDYLQDLGVEVVYLNPINVSPSTHKYDAADFYHVDPGFGGDQALHRLVDALHRRGMYLVVDASFNHCHPRFFAFQDVLERGPASRYRDWFTIYEYPIKVRYRPDRVRGEYGRFLEGFTAATGIPLEVADGEGPVTEPSYLAWYGVLDMPKLNQRNPDCRAYFLDVAAHWLREFGIDGWRMDVARHIEPDFWADFRRVTKAVRPDCFLLAEIWGNTAPWLQGDKFDATMNYILRDLCVAYFAQEAMDTPTFVDGIARMLLLYAPQVMAVTHNILSSHDTERFLHLAGGDGRRLRLATLLQLTLPGAPGLYYGDEVGLSGGKDPDCRRAFPWHDRQSWDRETLALVRQVIRLRRERPALRQGDWRLLWSGEDALAYLRSDGQERVLVAINRGQTLERLILPLWSQTPVLLWGEADVSAGGRQLVLEAIPGWSGVIVQL